MSRATTFPTWSPLAVGTAGLIAALLGFCAARLLTRPPAIALGATTSAAARSSAPSADGEWDARWREVSARPASPAQMRQREALLEELARTDPKRALSLALAESNWLMRDYLRNAALRGWGAIAPDDAANWAINQKLDGDRMQCVMAVLTGAAENPDAAVRVGLDLCAKDPIQSGSYGHALINALVEKNGSFDAAARFALEAKMVDRQSFLLDSAFYQWAQHDPERAREEFAKITDPQVRLAARKGIVDGWSDTDPQKLASFAQGLPAGDDRSHMFAIALPKWIHKDPDGALHWINSLEPDPDYDKGFAALSMQDSILYQRPEVALELTENIIDPAQRVLTKANVFYRWALKDPEAARKYAEAVPDPEERAARLEDVATAERARND